MPHHQEGHARTAVLHRVRTPAASLEVVVLGEEEQRRPDTPADLRLVPEAELREDRVDVLLTARLVMNSEAATALFDLPAATPASTSRSRGVSFASCELFARIRASTRTSTTSGSTTEPPGATSRTTPTSWIRWPMCSFKMKARPLGSPLEERQRVVRADVLADDDDADLRVARTSAVAA